MSSSVGRNSAIMAAGTLVSRLTGQIRTILLAAAVGTTGIAANAYQAGSTIPQVLFTILSGGIFNAVLVPQIVHTLKSKDAEEQLDKLVTFAVILLFVVTVVMMGGSSILTSIYLDSSWDPAQKALATSFTLWCMPQIFFYGLYTVLGQILAAQNRFGAYAWSSTGANVISCLGFAVFIALYGNASRQPLDFWTQDKVGLLAGSWTLGVAFQALILFVPLIRSGYRWRPRLGVHGIGLRSMGSVAAWSLGIVLVDQALGILTSRVMNGAPLHGGDAFTIAGNGTYQNAYTIYILPYSLFAVSIATAMFPRISEAIDAGRLDDAGAEISECLGNLTLIITFFTVAYLVEPEQITMALLPSVPPEEIHLIRTPLMLLSLSSLPASLILVLQRTFYAFKDGRTPFIYKTGQTLLDAALVVVGVVVLPPADWVSAVAGSLAIAYFVTFPVAYVLVHRRLPHALDDAMVVMAIVDALFAGALAGGAGWLVTVLFHVVGWDALAIEGMWVRWIVAVVQAAIVTVVIAGVYGGILAAMRVPQMDAAKMAVNRVAGRFGKRVFKTVDAESVSPVPREPSEPSAVSAVSQRTAAEPAEQGGESGSSAPSESSQPAKPDGAPADSEERVKPVEREADVSSPASEKKPMPPVFRPQKVVKPAAPPERNDPWPPVFPPEHQAGEARGSAREPSESPVMPPVFPPSVPPASSSSASPADAH